MYCPAETDRHTGPIALFAHVYDFRIAILRRRGLLLQTEYSVVCLSICHDREPSKKTAEPIKMPLGLWTWVGPRNHILEGGAQRRNLVNMTEPFVCGDDAALCQTYSN